MCEVVWLFLQARARPCRLRLSAIQTRTTSSQFNSGGSKQTLARDGIVKSINPDILPKRCGIIIKARVKVSFGLMIPISICKYTLPYMELL